MLLLVALFLGTPGEVLETRLEARVAGAGEPVRASVRYRLLLEEKTAAVPVRFLQTSGPVEAVQAAVEGAPLEVHLERSGSPKLVARVELGEDRDGALPLEIRYSVRGAATRSGEQLQLRLPVPVIDLPQRAARADAFHASVELPERYEVTESFPSGFRERGNQRHEVTLPLVPAFLSLRASPGGAFLPFERAVDLGAIALLAGLAALGLVHSRWRTR